MYGMSDQDTEGLADSILRSASITWVSVFHRPTSKATTVTHRLAKGIIQNRTLLTVIGSRHVDADVARDWLTVQEATRRNSGVVARAARLLKASVFDRYVVAALDRVTRHPALLAEVAKLVEMDKAELSSLIRDRLRRTETMDEFMRFAAVVKERVVCRPSVDGRTQLDALNEYCWRHVRQYLVLDDVEQDVGPTRKV
ncbi:hypothetical protein HPB52_009331 [Rhipicephalus sanguineus]|uniref:Uncharacterized protein n=1 Tax=Rhipicephalus sanguineus TaxID=34632 RepID=A0A9D4QFC7_RHISA|nr:hypothetical protein HPB52_009331 [Rhipicephalus sanguineus]